MTEPGRAAARWRLGAGVVLLRVTLAVLGAYAFAASFANLSGALLLRAGLERNDAASLATLLAFPVFLTTAFLTFAVRSTLWLVAGVLGVTALMVAGVHLLGAR